MAKDISHKELLEEVILTYRNIIDQRYTYKEILEKYDLPTSFDEKRVNQFRVYFLNYIYPDIDKRNDLNEAFESLDNYIKQPQKLFSLLLDSASLLFKYGRHLPKILKAGLKALQSFRAASHFENKIVSKAIESNKRPPFDEQTINQLIRLLPKSDLETFISNSQSLFETLHDRVLVKKIKEIVQHLIAKMKKKPSVYSAAEIRGMEIGYEIIKEGDLLFDQLSKEEQQQIFDFVIQIERDNLEEIYKNK